MNKTTLVSVAAGAVLLALSGCSSSSKPAAAAASGAGASSPATSANSAPLASTKASGSLTVACSQTVAFCQKMTAAFSAASGIKTSYVNIGAVAFLAKLKAANGPDGFDVWAGGQAENHLRAADSGFVEAY